MLIFDIETGPLPEEQLAAQFAERWAPPPHPGAFDPQSVKYGNTKDPAKRAEKLVECQQAHAAAVANYERDSAEAYAKGMGEFFDSAALDATTGRVLAIGMMDTGNGAKPRIGHVHTLPEDELLEKWWERVKSCLAAGIPMCGLRSNQFDLPFLLRRSWILGVDVPAGVLKNGGRYFADGFVDVCERWQCGDRQAKCNMDYLGRVLSLGGKPEGITGADFSRLFWSEAEADRIKAFEYLANDLELTRKIAARMGLV
jgi:hypothetical protein